MSEPDPTDRIAHRLYDARRPFYVAAWSDVADDHAMKQGCLDDARIAVEVIKEGERVRQRLRGELVDRVIEKPHCEPVPDPRSRWHDSKPETRDGYI